MKVEQTNDKTIITLDDYSELSLLYSAIHEVRSMTPIKHEMLEQLVKDLRKCLGL